MDRWLVRHLSPLEKGTDVSFQTWIQSCIYPEARKVELVQVHTEMHGAVPTAKECENESFLKKETYMAYKAPRGINSRKDQFKVFSGPFFKAIETALYSLHYFIKHIPIRARPQYISDLLSAGRLWYATDYTSFESSFTTIILNSLELRLYRYMLVNFPEASKLICRVLSGKNVCKFRDFKIKVPATRMSGDMCTSCGNGFSNLMIFLFLVDLKNGSGDGVFEGDDSLTMSTVPLHQDDYKNLGFDIKIVKVNNLMQGSFCGLVLSSEMTSMGDPKKALVNFGWSHSNLAGGSNTTRMGLLRAKSLSLVYEHPRCPILTALGMKGMALTRGYKARFEWSYYTAGLEQEINDFKDDTAKLVSLGVSDQIRLDFYEVYGIDPETQVNIEIEINNCNEFIDGPFTQSLYPSGSPLRDYFNRFTSYMDSSYDFELASEPSRGFYNKTGLVVA